MSAPAIRIVDDRVRIRLDRFVGAQACFLRVRRLPEKQLTHDRWTDPHTVTAPTRLAHLLDPALAEAVRPRPGLGPYPFDYQASNVARAMESY